MKERSPIGVWLLMLVTLGIYFWVWHYKIHAELNRRFPDAGISPGTSLAAVTIGALVVVPPFVSVAGMAGRINHAELAVGSRATVGAGAGVLLYILFGLHMPYYQSALNAIVERDRKRESARL